MKRRQLDIALLLLLHGSFLWNANAFPKDENYCSEQKDCDSNVCTQREYLLYLTRNKEIDPCEDFYKHVCSGWPDAKAKAGLIGSPEQQFIKDLGDALSRPMYIPFRRHHKESIDEKVRMAYRACLHETEYDTWKRAVKATLMQHGINHWPLTKRHGHQEETTLDELLKRTGFKPLLEYRVVKAQYSSGYELMLEHKSYTFIRIAEMDSDCENVEFTRLTTYARYLTVFLTTLSPGLSAVEAFDTASEILKVEINVAKIAKSAVSEEVYDLEIDSLSEIFYNLPVMDILRKDIPRYVWNFTEMDGVQIKDVETFKNLIQYLGQLQTRVLINYLGWTLVSESAQFTGGELQKAFAEMFRRESDTEVTYTPRHELCLDFLAGEMGVMRTAAQHVYLKSYFNATAKREVTKMINHLSHRFMHVLGWFYWMDAETRNAAKRKLKMLKYHVGYWNKTMDVEYVEGLYQYLPEFSYGMTFIGMYGLAARNNFLYDLRKLGKHLNHDKTGRTDPFHKRKIEVMEHKFRINPFVVHKYYDGSLHALVLPAASVYRTDYQLGLPAAMRYGGLGIYLTTTLSTLLGPEGTPFVENQDENTNSQESPTVQPGHGFQYGETPHTDHVYNGNDYQTTINFPDYEKYDTTGRPKSSQKFDEYNSKYKKRGSVENMTLWSEETKQHFEMISKCLENPSVEPITEFHVENKEINEPGQDFSPIDFSDYVGLRVAYFGYQDLLHYRSRHDEGFFLNADLCLDRLFFTAYAMGYCEPTEHYDSGRINTNLALFNRFAAAFGCSAKTKMNKTNTCHLFDIK